MLGSETACTAERCGELSQGYAFFAYPWKRSNDQHAHPGGVPAILDTPSSTLRGKNFALCLRQQEGGNGHRGVSECGEDADGLP